MNGFVRSLNFAGRRTPLWNSQSATLFSVSLERTASQSPLGFDRAAWHELKMTVDGTDFKAWLDGALALEYTLGSQPGPGRNGAAPNADLYPEKNPVLRPPVSGRVGLWSKTDSTSYFKAYVGSTPGKTK